MLKIHPWTWSDTLKEIHCKAKIHLWTWQWPHSVRCIMFTSASLPPTNCSRYILQSFEYQNTGPIWLTGPFYIHSFSAVAFRYDSTICGYKIQHHIGECIKQNTTGQYKTERIKFHNGFLLGITATRCNRMSNIRGREYNSTKGAWGGQSFLPHTAPHSRTLRPKMPFYHSRTILRSSERNSVLD